MRIWTRISWRWGIALVLALPGAALAAPTVGIFFDDAATLCTGTLEPFGTIRVHLFAFADPGTPISGALLRLPLPDQLQIVPGTYDWPKNTDQRNTSLTSPIGLDLQFQQCQFVQGPLRLVSFTLSDVSLGNPRPDLVLELQGGTIIADSLTLQTPHLKICDPADPEGALELIRAESLRATLNCSSECPCAPTPVAFQTWGAVKRLYLEP